MARRGAHFERRSNLFRLLYPPVPGHPIQTALREVFCKKWDALIYSCEKLPRDAESVGLGRYYRNLFGRQFGKVLEWVVETPFKPDEQMKHWDAVAETNGMGPQSLLIRCLLSDLGYGDLRLTRGRRGRPVERRHQAIQALELHLAHPRQWTWGKLARHFCNCDKDERTKDDHDRRCQERLNREVGHLKRFLKSLQIPLP
jgi:hypothetical protein